MKKLTASLFLLILFLSACSTTEQPKQTQAEAKKWIVNSVERYFRNFELSKNDYSTICTPQYTAFKTDATGVGFDGGLTEEQFKKKWGRRYSAYAGIGTGFLISEQDFGQIVVSKCEFRNETEMKGYLFDVVIEDKETLSKFYREIVVVPYKNSFLIENVKEIKDETDVGFKDQ